jgi:hypothetical protein
MDLRETGCEDKRWMELAQNRVQWQALVLAVLNLWVLPQPVNSQEPIFGKSVVRMGGGWNWLRIMSNEGL